MVEGELIKYAITQGIFAALFVALLFYVLKTTEKREEKYQEIITNLSSKYDGIHEEVREIKFILGGKN